VCRDLFAAGVRPPAALRRRPPRPKIVVIASPSTPIGGWEGGFPVPERDVVEWQNAAVHI
jgi:hypothetical protein